MNSPQLKSPIFIIVLVLFVGIFFIFSEKIKKASITSPIPTPQQDFLESYFKNINNYEESFSKFIDIPKDRVLATITSHHFLAKDLIAETFFGIDPSGIKTIIIVGPDHFKQINGPTYMAQTTDSQWHTPFGNMDPDVRVISAISQKKDIYSDINLFRSEHSIYTLIPFTKKVFPDAKIVPLVLKQKNDIPYYYDLGEKVSKMVNLGQTVLIISSDFTHNSTIQKAKQNDLKSINLLPDKRLEDLGFITNDCEQCMAFLFGYLKDNNTRFKMISNKNSFDISGENPESVTSYIGAYFIEE